jgi:peptidyl-prolyl cis-trans isomerase A (cyclophilin A)
MSTFQHRRTALALLLGLLSLPAHPGQPAAPAAPPAKTTTVVLQTSVGDIHIALDLEHAPQTAKNFLAYVDSGLFSRMTFYRAMMSRRDGSEGMIQGGMRNNLRGTMPPVVHEPTYTTGLSHVDGAVSMAYTSMPGSARTEFFIIVGEIPSYDGVPGGDPGYAVFGKVTKGMSVVRKILRLPTSKDARNPVLQGQMLVEPVQIVAARRVP